MLTFSTLSQSPRYKYWVFGAIAIGFFGGVADHGAVTVALPSISEDFQTTLPVVQWVIIGFALTISALLLPMGRLSDIIGRKKVYILGSVVLVAGSAVGGFAPSLEVLIPARIIQGCGAAMTQGTSMAIITSAFPVRERGKAIGLIMTTVGVGAVAGPAIGGLVVDFVGWRGVFFMTIPLVVLGIIATLTVLRNWEDELSSRGSGFDWLGAALSTGVLLSLLLGLTTAHRAGWTSLPIIASFVVSAGLLWLFVWWELRCRSPMLDLRFFKGRTFSMGVAAALLTFMGSSSVLFLMPFYLQNVLGYSAKVAGFVVVPGALSMAVLGSVSGVLTDRFGWRWFTVGGLASSACGLGILTQVTENTSLWVVMPALMLMSSGMGTFYSPNSSSILSSVAQASYGVVSGFLNLVRNAANVVSLAMATTIVTATMGSLGYEPSLDAVRGEGASGAGHAFTVGMRYAFMVMLGLVLSAMVVSIIQGQRVWESQRAAARAEAEEAAAGD